MRGRIGFLALVAALLAGCGGGGGTTGTTTATTPSQLTMKVYFFKGNALAPVTVHVPATQAVATAAIGALLAGPPAGYRTAVPAGASLDSVAIANGVATAHFSKALPRTARAQVAYTLTQFPTITSFDGATRADFSDLTPNAAIFVAKPIRDSAVTRPVYANGTADVFEGTFVAELWSDGKLLRTQTITASSGTGTRGTWSATFDLPPGPAKIVFYEPSAENGQPLHQTSVDLTVS